MGKEAGWEEQRAVRRAAQGIEAVHQGSSHWQRKMWLKKPLYPHTAHSKGTATNLPEKGIYSLFFLRLSFAVGFLVQRKRISDMIA